MNYVLNNLDFEVVAGPNSKQLWVYESINDVWIDPPKAILDSLDVNWYEDLTPYEDKLQEIVDDNPDWLYETDYWYDAEKYDI